MPTPEERAYLAGILDGEGHIGAGLRQRSQSRLVQLELRLNVSNTDRGLIEWIAERWPGGRMATRSRSGNGRWADLHRLDYSSQAMIGPLVDALPFLLVKRERAEWALELARMATRANGRRGYPPELRTRRDEIIAKLVGANRTGPSRSYGP